MSLHVKGPPTVPRFGSFNASTQLPPVHYVWPYASITGQQNATLNKLLTYDESGAPPDTINLTLPPRRALGFLKIRQSQNPWVKLPVFLAFDILLFNA